jgi:hypothetical protein
MSGYVWHPLNILGSQSMATKADGENYFIALSVAKVSMKLKN